MPNTTSRQEAPRRFEARGAYHCECGRAFVSRPGLGMHHGAVKLATFARSQSERADLAKLERLAAELEIADMAVAS